MPKANCAYTTDHSRLHPQHQNTLKNLSISDLVILWEGLQAGAEGILSIMNQPRCDTEVSGLLEKASENLDFMSEEVSEEIFSREPQDNAERDQMLRFIARQMIDSGEGAVKTFAALACLMSAET